MKSVFNFILFLNINALSWVCNYPDSPNIPGPVTTHLLYKEDNVNQVKWLEKVEYCRAKGDLSVYNNAGQGKCEYSRGICIWVNNNCIINSQRENDSYSECVDLLNNNELVDGLDNGRLEITTVTDNSTDIFIVSKADKKMFSLFLIVFLF